MIALCLALGMSLPAAAVTPGELGDTAAAAHPSVQALTSHADALERRADVAGAMMDPVLSVELSNLPTSTWSLGGHPMAGVQLRVQQTLRPPTWAAHSRASSGLMADAARADVDEAALRLRTTTARTAWLLVKTSALRALTEAHLARAEDLLAAARSRYETGATGQYAVLRAEVLRETLRDNLGDFDRSTRELTAALAEALGGPDPGPVDAALTAIAAPDDVDVAALATASRPWLSRLDVDAQAAAAAASLAGVDALPDVTVWAGYRVRVPGEMDDGVDMVSVGVGVPLPTGSARRAGGERDAWLAEADAAHARADAAVLEVQADGEAALARWSRAWERVEVLDVDLLPRARATVETTRAEFTVGRADFTALYDAEVALLDLERARVAAVIDTHLAAVELHALTGVDLEGP